MTIVIPSKKVNTPTHAPRHPFSSADVQDDLAGGAALVDLAQRLRGALEREARADDRRDMTGLDEGAQRPTDIAAELWASHRVSTPTGADHLGVAEQQPVDFDFGDRAAGESDDDHAALLAQRAQAVGEAIAADGVEHEVYATTGDLL